MSGWGAVLSPVLQRSDRHANTVLQRLSVEVVFGGLFPNTNGKFSDGGWDKLREKRHKHGIAAGSWREIQVIGGLQKAAEVQRL
jgi:hypothetical protein